jgi:hypothetical protein
LVFAGIGFLTTDVRARMKRVDKQIRYIEHAEDRLEERGVSRENVALALRHPDTTRPARRENARRFEKAVSRRRRLIVIAEERTTEFCVITAWWN